MMKPSSSSSRTVVSKFKGFHPLDCALKAKKNAAAAFSSTCNNASSSSRFLTTLSKKEPTIGIFPSRNNNLVVEKKHEWIRYSANNISSNCNIKVSISASKPPSSSISTSHSSSCRYYSSSISSASSSSSSPSSSDTTVVADTENETPPPPPPTTTTTTTSINEKWMHTTHQLLHEIPVGGFTDTNWIEAKEAFKHWMSFCIHDRQHYYDKNQHKCWNILDRLYIELNHHHQNQKQTNETDEVVASFLNNQSSPFLSSTEIFNPFLNTWRIHMKDSITSVKQQKKQQEQLLPSNVSTRLYNYELVNLICRDEYAHGMILDVSATIASLPQRIYPNDGIYFAERYIQDWITEYSRNPAGTPKPDAIAIGCIIHGWVLSQLKEAPEMAESWFLKSSSTILGIKPNPTLYTSVISAFANQGNVHEAHKWLNRMIDDDNIVGVPDIGAWNSLLSAHVKQQKSRTESSSFEGAALNVAEKVEQLLQQMWSLYKSGKLSEPPDVISYSIAIDAWAKQVQNVQDSASSTMPSFSQTKRQRSINFGSKQNDQFHGIRFESQKAARRALTLLNQMKEFSKQYKALKPNTITYNTIILAFARAGCAAEAENILIEMIEQQQQENDDVNENTNTSDDIDNDDDDDISFEATRMKMKTKTTAKPDSHSFAMLMYAWSKIGTYDAAERAESWLLEGMKRCGIQPTVATYSSCINCWANASSSSSISKSRRRNNNETVSDRDHNDNRQRQRPSPAYRAQRLFDRMKQEDGLVPDVATYTTLISAWGRQGYPWKAEEILKEVLDEYQKTRNDVLKPNPRLFSTVLSSWAKQSKFESEAAERAELLMTRMVEDYDVEPNIYHYSIVLDAWAKSQDDDAPDRARAILDHMNSPNSAFTVRPNELTYTTVVNAYANHGRAEEAEALLMEMLNDPKLPNPDMYTFSSVLSAWSKRMKINDMLISAAGEQEEEESSSSSSTSIPESSASSSSSSRNDNDSNQNHDQNSILVEASNRAERLFVMMHQLYNDEILKRPPNVVCYGIVLTCLARSQDPDAAERAESILRTMINNKTINYAGKNTVHPEPNLFCYNNVMNAWAQQARHNDSAIIRIEKLLEELEEKIINIPSKEGVQEQKRRRKSQSSLRPDHFSYRALMKAIAISDVPNKLDRGYDVLRRMERMGVYPDSGFRHQIHLWEEEQKTNESTIESE